MKEVGETNRPMIARKARRDFICSSCKKLIEKGSVYLHHCYREPRYAPDVMGNFVQDGIQYVEFRLCQRDDCSGHERKEV